MRKNGNNELNRGTKKSFVSILPIIGAGLLSAGAIAGVAASTWYVSQNYQDSAEFTNSASIRVKIDPVEHEIDHSRRTDENLAKENAQFAAERLSAWLKQNGQESYDVSYELEKPEHPEAQDAQYFAYLTAKFKISKVISKFASETDKVDNDPYLSIFEQSGFNTNNKSFIYRWYDVDHKTTPEQADPKYSILDFADLFVIPDKIGSDGAETKSMSDKDNKTGIVYKVNEKHIDFLNNVYNDFLKYKEDTKDSGSNKDLDVKIQPRIYIINNLEGMYNEASYHLTNYGYSQDNRYQDYARIYQDSDYAKFGLQVKQHNWKGDTTSTNYKFGTVQLTYDGKEVLPLEETNGDVLNWIDTKTAGTVEHTSIFSKYVEDIIPVAKIGDYFKENIDDDKIKNTIPTKIGDECKINYFWHPYSNKTSADTYISQIVDKSWIQSDNKGNVTKGAKIVSIDLPSTTEWKSNYNEMVKDYKATIISPKFTETIFGGNKLVGILSLGFLIYLVALGILLGCLYRTTGVFSWICMMFMLSMTGLIAITGSGMVMSMSLLFGLFILSIIGFVTAFGICGRMKRRLLSNEDTQVMVVKTFKQSLWPATDSSIIALIFGICFTYIAPLGLNALGLVLVVGAFANFIGTYLLNGLLHALFFNNKITINHYGWFGRGHSNLANEAISQGRNDLPIGLDATKLNFHFYSKFSKNKLDVTGKGGVIALGVIGAILVISIVLFTVLGFVNTNLFHTQNCLLVYCSNKDVINWVQEAGCNYSSYVMSQDGSTWYFYATGIGSDVITKLQAAHSEVTYATAQWIVGATNRDLLTMALVATLAGAGISTVYAGIRCNWTALVPMLAAGMGLPLIMLGIASACQLKFDETVVLAYAMITVVNHLVCINVINTINSVWSRHEGYSKKELKFIINEALKNDAFVYLLTAITYLLFIILFAIFSPVGCANLTILLIIGLVVTMLLSVLVIPALLYWFLVIRNAALKHRAKRIAKKVVVNYDEIDEQSIEGMNKFSKKIPIPKEDPVTHE